jgi:hypothetical protein
MIGTINDEISGARRAALRRLVYISKLTNYNIKDVMSLLKGLLCPLT